MMKIVRTTAMKKSSNYDFASKWSISVERYGYTSIPNLLIINQRKLLITNGEMVVLINILKYMWSDKNPYPAVSSIAGHSGMASKTIRKHIRSLENKGLVRRIFRKSNTNEYSLEPLRRKLELLVTSNNYTAQIRVPPLLDSAQSPYSEISTKEYSQNNTQTKRRSNIGNSALLGDLLNEKYGVLNER